MREQRPTLAIQRCTAHKLRNLEAKAPVRLREELTKAADDPDVRALVVRTRRASSTSFEPPAVIIAKPPCGS